MDRQKWDREADVVVVAVDLAFIPAQGTIPANTGVIVTLHNGRVALHNFGVDALKISVLLLTGETKPVTIDAPSGDYT